MKKIIIFGLVMILLSSFVFGALNDAYLYYSFDDGNLTGSDPDDLSGNGRDGTNNGATTGVAGKINEAFDYDGTGDYVSVPTISKTAVGSVCHWIEPDAVDATYFLTISSSVTVNYEVIYCYITSGEITCGLRNGGNIKKWEFTTDTANLVEGTDYHFCLVQDGTEPKVYLDGSEEDITFGVSSDKTLWTADLAGTIDKNRIASYGGLYFNGVIDEFGYWERAISSLEAIQLYNHGFGFNPYAEAELFSLTLIDSYLGNSITNFTAEIIENASSRENITTTNGTIYWNKGGIINITIYNVSQNRFFNNSYQNWNTLGDLEAEVNNTIITFEIKFNNTNFFANISNTQITDLNNSLVFVTSNGSIVLNPLANLTTFRFNCNRSVFENTTVTFNFTDLEESTYTIYVNPTSLNLTFIENKTGLPLNNYSITIEYPDSSEITLYTDSSGSVYPSYVYNDAEQFGTWNVTFDETQGLVSPISFDLIVNSSNVPFNQTFQIFTPVITINLYDRETYELLDGYNASIFIEGVLNQSTTNGTVIIQNSTIINGVYTIVALLEGFFTEQKTLEINSNDNVTIDFYLLNLTGENTGILYVNTINEFYTTEPDTSVSLLEYNLNTLSYETVSECYSNINGECTFAVELNVKKYIVTGSKTINGQVFSDTTSEKGMFIQEDEYVITLLLTLATEFEVTDFTKLTYSIADNIQDIYDDLTNTTSINVTFSTTDSSTTTVCIDYYNVTNNESELYNQTCALSSTGIIQNSQGLNRDITTRIQVYQLVGEYKILLFYKYIQNINSLEKILDDEELLSPFALIPFLILLAFSMNVKKIFIFFIGCPIIAWVEFAIFPTIMFGAVATFLTLMCIWLTVISIKKQSGV